MLSDISIEIKDRNTTAIAMLKTLLVTILYLFIKYISYPCLQSNSILQGLIAEQYCSRYVNTHIAKEIKNVKTKLDKISI